MKESCVIKKVNALEWFMTLQENSSLGLASKVKKSFDKVDAIENISQIQFEDPEVEHICHEHGVYTVDDAAKVSSIKGWFIERKNIKSFNELKYFTGLKIIEVQAFSSCISLESITIPNSVTRIGSASFYNCKSLQSVTIPNSVTSIGLRAFIECTSLQSITIQDGVTSIGLSAFYNCTSLQSVTIPSSVTSIGEHVFNGCKSLKSINIPDSVARIGDNQFFNCELLKVIYISKNCPVYNQIRKQYPDIQLKDPKVNESSSLGLNSKVKKNYEITHGQDINLNQLADFIRQKVYVAAGYSPDEDPEKVDYNLRVYTMGNCLVVDGIRITDEKRFYYVIDIITSDIKREETGRSFFKSIYIPIHKENGDKVSSALEAVEKSNRQVSGLSALKNELESIGWYGILKAMTNSRD